MKVALLRSEGVVPALSGPEAVFTEFGISNEVKNFCQTTVQHEKWCQVSQPQNSGQGLVFVCLFVCL